MLAARSVDSALLPRRTTTRDEELQQQYDWHWCVCFRDVATVRRGVVVWEVDLVNRARVICGWRGGWLCCVGSTQAFLYVVRIAVCVDVGEVVILDIGARARFEYDKAARVFPSAL